MDMYAFVSGFFHVYKIHPCYITCIFTSFPLKNTLLRYDYHKTININVCDFIENKYIPMKPLSQSMP